MRSQSQNEKNMKKIIFVCLIAVMCLSLSSQESEESLPEVYEKKVIIDAKWGDKPGEFGLELMAPPVGPGPYVFDKSGNIYIGDFANKRIQKYDSNGNLISVIADGQQVRLMEMLNDTIYAINFAEELLKIDTRKGDVLSNSKIELPVIDEKYKYLRIERIEKEGDKIFISRGNERFMVEIGENFGEAIWISLPCKRYNIDISYNSLRTVGTAKIEKDGTIHRFTITELCENGLVDYILFLGLDKDSLFYFEVGGSNHTRSIYVFEQDRRIIGRIGLPSIFNLVGESSEPLKVTSDGEIFYLYPTGDFNIDDYFKGIMPGKIQLIKWTLKK